jgi:phosphoribosylanthranilate isomerase
VKVPVTKICGLTRPGDVGLACELGAWAVGFVFAASRRQVEPARVRRLLEGMPYRTALAVGVFVDETVGAIVAAVEEAGLDAVQLHGGVRGPCAEEVREALLAARGMSRQRFGAGRVRGRGPWPLLIQAISVSAAGDEPDELAGKVAAAAGADILLFDTRTEVCAGGSGVSFPWPLVAYAAGDRPFLVAGGIGPANVREALDASGAWGVDVASGVEVSPGKKDEKMMRALFEQIRPEEKGGMAP